MSKTYYITTPIYYPSDKLHIGHSYTTVAADTIARYKKMRGFDVVFLTGTDEHGQKIERKARECGTTPKEYVDRIVAGIKTLWQIMDIDYDIFIRTTDASHEAAVKKIFKKLYDQGDIYKNHYEGLYCTPCETFFTERQLKDGKCPDCGRAVDPVREEAYFFRLSRYQDRLIALLNENPSFLLPATRRNEMLNNFLKPGLDDLCVSRTSFTWGVPVEFDPGHVVYVWIDALSNYITALGYLSEDDSAYRKYWPADVHLVGKEIVRFHTIIWPAMLMALNEPLPKQIFGHGWLIIDGGKMSKSKGNVVDPAVLTQKYGVDAIRYFLLREIAFGQDGNFTYEALLNRINSDLANDLGNLLSRTVGMIDKYFGGCLPQAHEGNDFDASLQEQAAATVAAAEAALDSLRLSDALAEIWNLVRRANKYVDETQPWLLAKAPDKQAALAGVLYALSETLRILAVLIAPFMPNTPGIIRAQLGINRAEHQTWDSVYTFGLLDRQVRVTKGEVTFPRIDVEKELAAVLREKTQADAAQAATGTDKTSQPQAATGTDKPSQPQAATGADSSTPQSDETDAVKPEIGIDEFGKIQLVVGTVLACEKIAGSSKLLKSQIRIGRRVRQIVSGIAAYYTPEEMVGKRVIVVANLKPVKLRGVLSEGMILCAASEGDGKLAIVDVPGDIPDGAEVR